MGGGEDAKTYHVGECVYVCLMQVNQVGQATLLLVCSYWGRSDSISGEIREKLKEK
jgi:hypothetical protein